MRKILLTTALLLGITIATQAQSPQLLNYQGVARNAGGSAIATSPIGLQIKIHDGSVSGTVVYEETQTPTTNSFGLYNVSVGAGTVVSGTFSSINWADGPKYMEVGIDPAGGASYVGAGTAQLLSVPYSIYSNTSNTSNSSVSTSAVAGTANYIPKFTASGTIGDSRFFDNGTSVGLDTITPTPMAKLQVNGVGTYGTLPFYQAGIVADGSANSASATGVYGESGWRGVYGRNPGTATGTEAIGVLGRVEGSSYTGTGYGVKGECAGTGGTSNYGVYGTASGTGFGIAGVSTGTGAAGKFDGGATGKGILVNGLSGFGTTTPSVMSKVQVSGVGTYSVAPYYQAGIVADGSATVASASGVYGESGWKGVYGRNPGSATGVQAIGVHGRCEGSSYTGGGYGVLAEAVGTGATNYGIYASATGGTIANYAGYFSGNVHITGSISKGSGTFMIDHPLDPENKYLYHSFVESPDMMNIYNGNVVTDASGTATVSLPDYFDALNKDFRYQLTVIGTFAQAIISKEISGNTFEIKTNVPNVKVSWMVTGVRQDKYANAHRVVPEVEKAPQDKGHYLHAAEWGQPESKSIDALIQSGSGKDNTGK